jgi:hypothetical protein
LSPSRSVIWPVLLASALTFAALAPGLLNNVDAYVVYHGNRQLVTEGRLWVDDVPGRPYVTRVPYVRPDEAGRAYPVFGHVFSWITLPFFAVGHALERESGALANLSEFTFSLANCAVTGLGIALWSLVALRLGLRRRSLPGLVALLALTTPVLFYAVSMWRDPGLLTLLGAATLLALRARERPTTGRWAAFGASLGLMFLFKEATAVLIAPLWIATLAGEGLRERRLPIRAALAAGLPILAAIGIHMTILGLRFGDPLGTCYAPERELLGDRPLARLGRLVASPDVGLMLYAPLVVLGALAAGLLARRDRAGAIGLIVASTLFAGMHALVTNGEGGRFVWGPRHLVPVFPVFLVALALAYERAPRLLRVGIVAVALLSAGIQLLPIVQPYHLYPALRESAPEEVAEAMPRRIPGSAILAGRLVGGGEARIEARAFGVDDDHVWDLTEDRVAAGGVNVWWLRRDAPGAARGLGAALALAAGMAWWWLRRVSREGRSGMP